MIVNHTARIVLPANTTVAELKDALATSLSELASANIPDSAGVVISYQKAEYDQRDNWSQPATVTVEVDW